MILVNANTLNLDAARFGTGLTIDAFVARIDTYQDEPCQRLRDIRLTSDGVVTFAAFPNPRYVAVLIDPDPAFVSPATQNETV